VASDYFFCIFKLFLKAKAEEADLLLFYMYQQRCCFILIPDLIFFKLYPLFGILSLFYMYMNLSLQIQIQILIRNTRTVLPATFNNNVVHLGQIGIRTHNISGDRN